MGSRVGALVAGVEAAGGSVSSILSSCGEWPADDAEVGFEEVVDGQAGVGVKFFGDGLPLGVGELGALEERGHVVAEGVFLDFSEEGLEGGRLVGELVVVPGGGGVGGQREGVSLVDAGVGVGAVDAVVEARGCARAG